MIGAAEISLSPLVRMIEKPGNFHRFALDIHGTGFAQGGVLVDVLSTGGQAPHRTGAAHTYVMMSLDLLVSLCPTPGDKSGIVRPIGVIVCGIVIPLAIAVSSYFVGDASTPLLIFAIALHIIGAFALKYCLLKAGVHNPILPVTTSSYH